ncbi:MAG TPA: indole-3-glycerol-phosphate synthase TrpC, partial [Actinoplanes sp.]|nr:indole-3-glycerol-phosphate synthase TrpC [Actinoplanes sp.]
MTSDQQAEAGSGGPQNVLEEILAGVREDVAARQEQVPLEQVREAA